MLILEFYICCVGYAQSLSAGSVQGCGQEAEGRVEWRQARRPGAACRCMHAYDRCFGDARAPSTSQPVLFAGRRGQSAQPEPAAACPSAGEESCSAPGSLVTI